MHRKKLPLGQPYLLATKLDRAGLHHHLFQLTAHAASHIFGAANEFDFRAMGGLHIILAAKVATIQKRDFGFVRIEGFPQIARQSLALGPRPESPGTSAEQVKISQVIKPISGYTCSVTWPCWQIAKREYSLAPSS